MKQLLFSCLIASTLFAAANANAYYVRPVAQMNSVFSDGLIQNAATSASQNIGSAVKAKVDLNNGTGKAFVDITGANQYGQAVASFGDRVSFSSNAVGTTADFSFAFDGTIDVTGVTGGSLQYGYSTNYFVFEAGSGATFANFTSHGGHLIGQNEFNSFTNPLADVSTVINGIFSDSIVIGSVKDFDIFASIGVFTSTQSHTGNVTLDFFNTGTFSIDVASGVTYSSQSGVFLNSVVPPTSVPVPGTLALLGLGLLVLIGRRRLVLSDK